MSLEIISAASADFSANSRSLAVFPGAFNPPTVAHVEIARAALQRADRVLWTLPRAFPHKSFEGASFAQRCQMLRLVTAGETRFAAAVSDGGLYAEIAAEALQHYGASTEVALVCGRDAAERIAGWDYGRPGVFGEMLQRHPLLVAARSGEYSPPERHVDRVQCLPLLPAAEGVSSSEVRDRIRKGEPWEHLVPLSIGGLVREIYGIN